MDDLKGYFHLPPEIFWGVVAIAGGVARYLTSLKNGNKPFNLFLLFCSAFVAGFSGYIFALWGQTMQLPPDAVYIMAGVGGFFGEQSLKYVYESITQRSNVN